MRFENVSIVSLAHVDGPIRMPSSEIEARIKPTMDRLGIRQGLLRRFLVLGRHAVYACTLVLSLRPGRATNDPLQQDSPFTNNQPSLCGCVSSSAIM